MRRNLSMGQEMKRFNSSTVRAPHQQKNLNYGSIEPADTVLEHDRGLIVPAVGETVRYLPPFEFIRRSIEILTVRGELRVNISYENFIAILRQLLQGVEVDEAWYTRAYEDIGSAVKGGVVGSAKQHFVHDGYFEGRLPFPIRVDESWYLAEYPDVAASMRQGSVESAQQHFEKDGYREGRLPFGM
jgi:hypothetical protein